MSTQSIPQLSHQVLFLVDSKNSACSTTYVELVKLLIHKWDHLLIVIMLPFQESVNLNSNTEINKLQEEEILRWPHFKPWMISSLPHPEVLVSVVSFFITPYCPQNFALMQSYILLTTKQQIYSYFPIIVRKLLSKWLCEMKASNSQSQLNCNIDIEGCPCVNAQLFLNILPLEVG